MVFSFKKMVFNQKVQKCFLLSICLTCTTKPLLLKNNNNPEEDEDLTFTAIILSILPKKNGHAIIFSEMCYDITANEKNIIF